MSKYYVYQITNLITGQIYIGYSNNPKNRFKRHLRNSSLPYYLYNCMNKYDWWNFYMHTLFTFDTSSEALLKEQEVIKKYKTNIVIYPNGIGMNMTDGGDGFINSPKAQLFGKDNHRFGKTGMSSKSSKKVVQIDKDTKEEIAIYFSLSDANRETGIAVTNISKVCRDLMYSSGGYIWRYFGYTELPIKKVYKGKKHWNSRPVLQYDLGGNFIKEHDSASSIDGLSCSGIVNVCKGINKSYKEFIWIWKECDEYPIKIIAINRIDIRQKVIMYNKNMNIIGTFSSIAEASRKTNINRSGISNCVNNTYKTAGGYIWKRDESTCP
jgi:predicted GIY-YIG superfamily endonuclease